MANYHLAILKRPYLEAILSGRKRVESRFGKIKRSPFGQIRAGDKIFFKVSSGPVCATATISAVKEYAELTGRDIFKLKCRYNHLICGSDEYWRGRADCGFGFLVWLKDIKTIEPIRINKKDWRGWVVLTEKENFGLLKSQGYR